MTTQVIDGLKARSYGLKKSLEEKGEKINQIYEKGERYYPASQKEGVDQWGVFPRKIEEFNQHINQNEKAFKQVLKEDLKQTYENQRQQKEQRYRDELEEKQKMARQIREQDMDFVNRQHQANQEFRSLRKVFDEQNQLQIKAHQEEQLRLKMLAKEEERRRLAEVEESLRLEKKMRDEKLREFRNDVKTVNTYVDMKRAMERNQQGIEKQQDRDLIQSYIDNELKRAQAYNNHFQAVSVQQRNNQEKYLGAIERDLQRKYQTLQKEDEDVHRYNRMQEQKAMSIERQRNTIINGTYADNRDMISEKESIRRKLKEQEERENQQLREAMVRNQSDHQQRNLDEHQYLQREEAKRQRELYKETLDRQHQSKEFEKRYYGNMSRVEKEMNRFDLRTYKKNESELNCMIPGIRNIPSVGSQPTRGGNQLIKMQQEMLNSVSVKEMNRPEVTTAKTNASAQLGASPVKNSISIVADDKLRGMEQRMSHTSMYNPITNPLPGYQQNPYLMRHSQRSPVGNSVVGYNESFGTRRVSNPLQNAAHSVLDKSL